MQVMVIDANKLPLNPIHPGGARRLLNSGKAAVYRRYPFVIILKSVIPNPDVKPLKLKIDPGAKTTGFALVQNDSSIWKESRYSHWSVNRES